MPQPLPLPVVDAERIERLIRERRDEDAEAPYEAPVSWDDALSHDTERSVDFYRDVFRICHHVPDLFGEVRVGGMLDIEDDITLNDAEVAIFVGVPGTGTNLSVGGSLHELLPIVPEGASATPAVSALVSIGARARQLVDEFNAWLLDG